MEVRVNGENLVIESGVSVKDFLESKEFDPTKVAVEMNGDIVSRKFFEETLIMEGAQIEVVRFVGGG